LQEFHRIPDEPNSIECLRQFVFALAMRGRLSAPDLAGVRAPADHRPPAHLQKTRIEPYQLPREWRWSTTAEVGTARLGKMLDKAKNRGTPRRYLRNINVRWFGFDLSDVKVMPFEDAELSEFELRAGDVLICEGGEPGRAAVWDARGSDVYFQKAVHRVRLNPEVLPLFLVYYLKSASYEGRLAPHATGATFQHLTGKGLATLPVPVPPIDEQHRIVAKVDALMALCDELEAAQAEREARRDRLRTTSLRNLVAPDESKANARFLLRNSPRMITKPEHVAGVRQAILDLAVRGRLVRREGDWIPSNLGAVGRWGSGGTPATGTREFYGGSIPWIVIGDLNEGVVTKTAQTITEAGLANSSAKLIDPGTVLIAMYGASVGKLGIAGTQCSTNQAIANCVPDPSKIDRNFLFLLLRSIRAPLVASAKGGAQPNISQTVIKGWKVDLPLIAEQRRIVAKIEELMAVCDELE
jgi:type I restriction enzyme S subunit